MVCAARWKTVRTSYSATARCEQRRVAEVAADDTHFRDQAAAHELAVRQAVTHQADDLGARFHQSTHEPRTDEAGRPGDEDRTVLPEG